MARVVRIRLALTILAALAAPLCVAAAEPSRIVAVSDVHGAYDTLVALLRSTGLVDEDLAWTGGEAALVFVGDSVDRGADSRRVLELAMRLESAAPAAGGQVHLVLGNHEVINLVGDLRYVSPGDFAAYAADEVAADRAAAWARFRGARADEPEAALAAEFARRYPPGFFGHRAAFAPRGALGAWLLERPVVLVLGRTAFVHGGFPEAVAGGAAEINARYRTALRDYTSALEALEAADVLHPEDPFERHAAIAGEIVRAGDAGQALPDAVRRAAGTIVALQRSEALAGSGVYWYRGGVGCSPALETDRIARAKELLGVDRIVVGHTPSPSSRVLSRFDGALIRIDTGMQRTRGRGAAVVLRGAEAQVVYAGEPGAQAIEEQPRRVGVVPTDDDDVLESVLRAGAVLDDVVRADGTRALRLAHEGVTLDAVFEPLPPQRRGTRNVPPVAAYRLDRLLGLDLVPVTVLREIGADAGVLYVDPAALPDERQRRAARAGAEAWCPLADQFGLSYVLDVLTHSPGRAAEEIRYRPQDWQLVLTGNRALFGTGTDVPEHLRPAPLRLSAELRARLEALTSERLAAALGDVLDAERVAALLARRDRLLRDAAR